MKKIAIAAVLAASSFLSAHAAAISGLVNTGSFASGVQDTNYVLNGNSYGYVTYDNAWPVNPWLANTSTSKWITPTANQAASLDPVQNGTYSWTLSFNLSGFDASTASFSGQFAADNQATVKLNGVVIGSASSFSQFSSFAANSGFIAGVNTLEFVLTNFAQGSGNPAGLRVEFLQSNVVTAVPEPETYAMLLAGLGLIGTISRRRMRHRA
ncbi:PEP-CTERM sorting domain-containing protein [Rhodoferax sp. TH121]|uniref:PEP-CTERM sorting domain-containing protein n=1 Tax=Rhodoferax sp. TH121 TaxID=2022803 RepID=UPI000B97188A|nr:PEP-CTERM sorting domain-containing protein [Rhodoferax sp. TH121]OYQ38701.1 PEP-CTERM sorting domain-containing protein [Rhodoferax sp. TH121]